ncbi:DUF2807 domain-containing protein [uncultured Psychrobacter sp.]|uniref:GIN domain-containing protein n=1 Tax=uncultured Psychrobacter sp. TaxID=259303 RepID=UPI0030DB8C40
MNKTFGKFIKKYILGNTRPSSNITHGNSRQGNNDTKTISIDLQPFDYIESDFAAVIDFEISNESAIEITADSNLLELITFTYKRGKLEIGLKSGAGYNTQNPVRVSIKHSHLSGASVDGATKLSLENIKQALITIRASGAAKVKIQGMVSILNLEARDAATVDAKKLKTSNADIKVSDASVVKSSVVERVNIRASDAAQAFIYSNPEIKEVVKRDAATIIFKK